MRTPSCSVLRRHSPGQVYLASLHMFYWFRGVSCPGCRAELGDQVQFAIGTEHLQVYLVVHPIANVHIGAHRHRDEDGPRLESRHRGSDATRRRSPSPPPHSERSKHDAGRSRPHSSEHAGSRDHSRVGPRINDDEGHRDNRRDGAPSERDRGRDRDRPVEDRRRTEADRMSERAQRFGALPPPPVRGRASVTPSADPGGRADRHVPERTGDRPADHLLRAVDRERERDPDRITHSWGGSADPRSVRDNRGEREPAAAGHGRDTRGESDTGRGGESGRRHQSEVGSTLVRGQADGRAPVRGGWEASRRDPRGDDGLQSRWATLSPLDARMHPLFYC